MGTVARPGDSGGSLAPRGVPVLEGRGVHGLRVYVDN
jgi:hypothetical protein